MYTGVYTATSLAHCLLLKVKKPLFRFILFWWDVSLACISSSRYRENLSCWLTFGVSSVIQLLTLWATGQIPVWDSSRWHKGHFSCWSELNNTVKISLCVLHKHKYHGISSHIWCYFISVNNCNDKTLKGRLSEVQIFGIWFMPLSPSMSAEKSKWKELISVRWPASQQAKAMQFRWGIFLLLVE